MPISNYLFFLVNFNLKLNRGDFNYFSSLSLKQFFTVNDTPFPIAIVRKTTPPLFFGRSFRLLLLLPFSPDLSWAILHHPQLNVCKDHSWFYYRGILSPHAHDNLALSKDTLSQIPLQRWARFQVIFQDIWIFQPIFVSLRVTCLVPLFDNKLQVFKHSSKWIIFGIFNELLSTQNLNLARFARNLEWYIYCDFQTLCFGASFAFILWFSTFELELHAYHLRIPAHFLLQSSSIYLSSWAWGAVLLMLCTFRGDFRQNLCSSYTPNFPSLNLLGCLSSSSRA